MGLSMESRFWKQIIFTFFNFHSEYVGAEKIVVGSAESKCRKAEKCWWYSGKALEVQLGIRVVFRVSSWELVGQVILLPGGRVPRNTRRSGFQLCHSYILLDIKIWRVGSPASRAGLLFLKVHKSASRTEALCQRETIIHGLEARFRCTGSLRAN